MVESISVSDAHHQQNAKAAVIDLFVRRVGIHPELEEGIRCCRVALVAVACRGDDSMVLLNYLFHGRCYDAVQQMVELMMAAACGFETRARRPAVPADCRRT